MNGIFRYRIKQPVTWFNQAVSKSNQYCLYCGRLVGVGATISSNKEHLVGREFVPTGAFGDGTLFNFIFRACEDCNNEKSNIERHISTVSLYNSPARRDSQIYNDIANRKAANDYYPNKQGVLIKDSDDNLTIAGGFGRSNITFGLSSPPQVEPTYFELLAFRHIQGIFSLITSHNPLTATGTTLLSHDFFHFFGLYNHADWGNPHLIEIMSRVCKFPCYANIETANGFFKVIIRKRSADDGEWFWALEWNKSYRVIGAIANINDNPAVFRNLPALVWKELGIQDGATTRIREETPLNEEQDILFVAQVEGVQIA
ncbi:MAG: hypothetical protein Q7T36_01335 [Fluviicoccus sp.]|uniref:hypothetical protein n=1 Tax=Fluviicoccus sp. TaxID=2003552 RepID=UPI00271771CF|nr:hypothetical protein [Fluviicoccus sp.]MDO8329097.1 hypothetical protein [Fluviicoccus sp.]